MSLSTESKDESWIYSWMHISRSKRNTRGWLLLVRFYPLARTFFFHSFPVIVVSPQPLRIEFPYAYPHVEDYRGVFTKTTTFPSFFSFLSCIFFPSFFFVPFFFFRDHFPRTVERRFFITRFYVLRVLLYPLALRFAILCLVRRIQSFWLIASWNATFF